MLELSARKQMLDHFSNNDKKVILYKEYFYWTNVIQCFLDLISSYMKPHGKEYCKFQHFIKFQQLGHYNST